MLKYRDEYRINKKGAECYRTENLEEARARLWELGSRRPGVYTIQTRQCVVNRYGCLVTDGAGTPIWERWSEGWTPDGKTFRDVPAFVAGLLYGEDPEPMTLDDAAYNLDQYRKEGRQFPEGITPGILAAEWNLQIKGRI